MQAAFSWLGASLCLIAAGSVAQAQPYYAPCPPAAPYTCGPGFYAMNPQCSSYGPCYYVCPPFPPFSGMPPACTQCPQPACTERPKPACTERLKPACTKCPKQECQQPLPNGPPPLPIHLFARSPRDYFMQD